MYQHNIPEFTVSEFSKNIKRIIEDSFGYIKIRGEISGFKKAMSGHLYFSLKDQKSLISAVCFRNMAGLIQFEIANGLEVIASGKITIYEGRSNYQIIVEKLEIAGIGTIMENIEKSRKKLLAEGLFDTKYKKPLPTFPAVIGVITSKGGVVIEDIIHKVSNRFPTDLLLYPAAVQGKTAALEIALGIKYFNDNKINPPSVIIIARGGGSFEDLLPFNDEGLVRAVFKSKIPIISAIGHETDTTLIDYVSDIRASTPTAAAQIATPLLSDFKNLLDNLDKRLAVYLSNLFLSKENNLTNLAKHIIHPKKLWQQKEQELKLLINSLIKPADILNNYQKQLSLLIKDLTATINIKFKAQEGKIELAAKLLDSYHYKNVLARGYALVWDEQNQIITKIADIKNNQQINIEMSDGNVNALTLKEMDNSK